MMYPRNDLTYAENFLHMMFNTPCEIKPISPVLAKAMDRIFILHADHEQNASTSTVRLAGSSGANPFACIAAGIAALWGPAHGGANEAVLTMLDEIGDVSNIDKYIAKAKDKNDPCPITPRVPWSKAVRCAPKTRRSTSKPRNCRWPGAACTTTTQRRNGCGRGSVSSCPNRSISRPHNPRPTPDPMWEQLSWWFLFWRLFKRQPGIHGFNPCDFQQPRHRFCTGPGHSDRRSNVGAGLLAKTECQPA